MTLNKRKRILIKISGGCLQDLNKPDIVFNSKLIDNLAQQIQYLHKTYDIGLVIGGGNFWRGKENYLPKLDERISHYVGMLATVMNGLVIQNIFEKYNLPSQIFSAINCHGLTEVIKPVAMDKALSDRNILIFSGGTGLPYFSTDTITAIRAIELNAICILMGKDNVKGVYDSDPKTNPNAKFYKNISYDEILEKKLKVMDLTALTICKEHNLEILVFNQAEKNSFVNALDNKIEHTKIK